MSDHAPAASAHSHDDGHGHADHGMGHACPMWILVSVWLTLMVLTVTTLTLSNMNFGRLDLPIAMSIATVKATLVMAYFMHLRWDKPYNAVVFLASFLFAAIFFSFALLDTGQFKPDVDQRLDDIKAQNAAAAAPK